MGVIGNKELISISMRRERVQPIDSDFTETSHALFQIFVKKQT